MICNQQDNVVIEDYQEARIREYLDFSEESFPERVRGSLAALHGRYVDGGNRECHEKKADHRPRPSPSGASESC